MELKVEKYDISSFDKISSDILKKEVLKISDKYLADNSIDYLKTKNIPLSKDNLLLSSNGNHKVRCNGILVIHFLSQNRNSNFTKESAQKFGHINKNQLYLEYSVSDDYFSSNNEDSINFIEENNTRKIIISFSNTTILLGNNIEYTLDL